MNMSHLRPDAFMTRLRTIGAASATTHFVQHVVGSAAKAVDAVDADHASHLLLVGLLAFLAPRSAADAFFQGPTHGDAFTIKGRDENFAFFVRRCRRLLSLKLLHVICQLPIHMFCGP